GAQVIISLFGAIPVVGDDLVTWIRGDYFIADATINRFAALHFVALPFVLVGLVVAHLMALHEVGSNNPDGVEIKKHKDENGIPLDGVPFHPYYTVKDIFGTGVFLMFFVFVIFFIPDFGGYFLEKPNFEPANPMVTPEHIAPVWYFTPQYAMLRAITVDLFGVPAKLWGVVVLGGSVVILFFLPWLDRSPVKSIRYRGWIYKTALALFTVSFIILGWLGTEAPTPAKTLMAQIGTAIYFGFFLLMPIYTKLDPTKPEPDRITMPEGH
ncbi:MAG: cytochrome bc complex cytochrome b subunit, partial [Salinisphaeraceae bacterium]|nr:cytochrome bc complex cytochrome b subunit [Salinisphaeraceae bacterium]